MSSPFKFLDFYKLEDRASFFGRDAEIEQLYKTVFKTPLLLLYGLSGTGKTSLVQCGLASRFQGPDWYPLFIRRGKDLNASLRATLRQAAGQEAPEDITGAVSHLFRHYLRPVYLIFDQFEELFILGNWEEQKKFAEDLQALLKADLPCKILLVMREEYLGQLYHFEQVIPQLFDYRMRVERMNPAKVKAVLESSFEQFNITLEPPAEERLQQIIDNISGEKSDIQLPYLQVYLHMLYEEDYDRTYGDDPPDTALPSLTFTKEEIRRFGPIEKVLEKFLIQQREELQSSLGRSFRDLPEQAVRKVLDTFVTNEGTKRPVTYTYEGEGESRRIELEPAILQFIGPLPPGALTACLEALQERRLLRFSEESIELAHDSLAALIDDQRTDEQKHLNEVKLRIANNYREWERTGEYLSRRALISLERDLPKIQLEEHLAQFIVDSEAEADRLEREEEQRRQAELKKERQLRGQAEDAKDKARKNAQTARQRLRIAGIALAVAVAFLAIAAYFYQDAQEKAKIAQEQRDTADSLRLEAIRSAEQFRLEIVNRLLREAQVFEEAQQYYYARQRLDTALARDPGNRRVLERLESLEQKQKEE